MVRILLLKNVRFPFSLVYIEFLQIITDNQLFVMVFIFVLVDIVILILWHAIDAMSVKIQNLPEKVSLKENIHTVLIPSKLDFS